MVSWFADNGYPVVFAESIEDALKKKKEGHPIILLENVRFFPGEKGHDEQFAKQLARLGTYYVNDAYATVHRSDTSITLLPALFDEKHKSIGLLVEHEFATLKKMLEKPEKPFLFFLGGGKVGDKIPVLEPVLDKVSAIFLGPAVAFTFLKALGKPIGKSLVDDSKIDLCKELISQAEQRGIKIHYPVDYIIAEGRFEGPLETIETDVIPSNAVGVSIGPKTADAWSKEILQAKTIFLSGLMGTIKRPETLEYFKQLLQAMGQTDATTIIGGGDSVAAVQELGYAQGISYLSTGGGATLAYISGKPLPGILSM